MVEIDLLREQNPWWISKEKIIEDEKVKEAFKRKNPLLYTFQEKENKLLIGPRQTGKTTYLKLLIHDLILNKNIDPQRIFYFSCEILKSFEDIVDVLRKSEF